MIPVVTRASQAILPGLGTDQSQLLKPARIGCEKRRLAECSDSLIQSRESRVCGMSADVTGVDLLNDHRDLVNAEAVVEEDAGHVAPGLVGVTDDQLLPGQAAG